MSALDPKATLRGDAREAWLEFAEMHRARAHSPRTIETYGECVAQLQGYLDKHQGRRCVLEAERKHLTSFLAWVAQPPRSASTAANRYRGLVQFYKWAAAEGIVPASPMTGVECPKHEYKVPGVLTDDQLRALLATTARPRVKRTFDDIRDEAILRVFCEAGSPRASEMAALQVDDFDMEGKTITIRYGKGGRTRVIGMSASTSRAVFRYRRARAAHPRAAGTAAMWLGGKGPLTRSGLGQMTQRRSEQASLPMRVHPHQLRHTAFADFDTQSGNVNHEMALFGWSSPAMAHHYGKAARAANAIAAAQQLSRADRLDGARR